MRETRGGKRSSHVPDQAHCCAALASWSPRFVVRTLESRPWQDVESRCASKRSRGNRRVVRHQHHLPSYRLQSDVQRVDRLPGRVVGWLVACTRKFRPRTINRQKISRADSPTGKRPAAASAHLSPLNSIFPSKSTQCLVQVGGNKCQRQKADWKDGGDDSPLSCSK